MKKYFIKKPAFTLLEIAVAVIIIGIIFTIVSVSFNQARRNQRDTQRITDIRQIQFALELYYNDMGTYPDTLEAGAPLINPNTSKVYLAAIPQSPKSNSSNCEDDEYGYIKDDEINSYYLSFCLEKEKESLSSGPNCINPNSDVVENCYFIGFKNRITITIPKENISGNDELLNFPIYLDLANLPVHFFDNTKNNGQDIRISLSDNKTELARELVYIDTVNKEGELHFKVPSLSPNTDNIFYLYYNNDNAEEYQDDHVYGTYNVWDNYVGVWHKNDLTSGSIKDSTSNQLTGTKRYNNTPYEIDSIMGKGQRYINAHVSIPSTPLTKFADNDFTVSVWAYRWITGGDWSRYLVSQWNTGAVPWSNEWLLSVNGQYANSLSSAISFRSDNISYSAINTANTQNDIWYYVVGRRDSEDLIISENSLDVSTTNIGSVSIDDANRDLIFGAIRANSNMFNGLIDEVRISNVARSNDWIKTEYDNQSNPTSFYAVSDVEIFY